jgi:hypothetical protein
MGIISYTLHSSAGKRRKTRCELRDARVDGLMLGWSLGGYPSPNLEVVAELGGVEKITPQRAMEIVAERRYGKQLAPAVVQAWKKFSKAFSEFPFGGGLYHIPVQTGPANLLWSKPTNYRSGAVGLPYDDFASWRAQYPPEIFIEQIDKIATGFESALEDLKKSAAATRSNLKSNEREAIEKEINVAEVATLHFLSATNQSSFVYDRNKMNFEKTCSDVIPQFDLLV